MESASGTVRSLSTHADGRRAVVEVDVNTVCARCAAGSGCGAGLLRGAGRVRQIEARVTPGQELREGDSVRVVLQPRDLLRAAVAAYGPPLLGATIATATGYGLDASDVGTAAAALGGMAGGLFASRLYLARTACLSRFVPRVERCMPGRSRED